MEGLIYCCKYKAKFLVVEQTVAHIKELSQVLNEPNVFIQGFEYEEVKDLTIFPLYEITCTLNVRGILILP